MKGLPVSGTEYISGNLAENPEAAMLFLGPAERVPLRFLPNLQAMFSYQWLQRGFLPRRIVV